MSAEESLVKQIADTLTEPNHDLIRVILTVLNQARVETFLQQTLETEAQGGLLVRDGSRRRTPGGVFFHLVRHGLPKKEMRKIWPHQAKGTQQQAIQAPTWDEVKTLVSEALQVIGEAKTVKITLVGRPGRVVQQQACVVVAMKGKEPPSLPKGLPTPPANSAVTWAVFIANKQWTKVKDSLQGNKDDHLIIEGYPLMDPKSGSAVVLATSVKSVAQERAQREEKKASQ